MRWYRMAIMRHRRRMKTNIRDGVLRAPLGQPDILMRSGRANSRNGARS